jgi:predicted membrane channel-forming protein YqfA (hemolysin III family)
MAPPITFHLNACSVSSGVQARNARCRDEDCLVHMRARPLVGASSSTDVSSSAGLSLRFQAAPQPPPVAAPIPPVVGFKLDFASLLTASLGTAAQSGLEAVERFAPAPMADAARTLHTRIADAKPPPQSDVCVLIDQYEVGESDPADPSKPLKKGCSRLLEVVRGVLCSNPRPVGSRWSTLLGPTGHYERFSAWSHIVGTVLYLGYAIVRLALPGTAEGAAQILTTVAAFGVVFVFFSSSIYHSTAPDATLAYYTRFLDYFAIYLGIVLTATADIAVATQGFRNVPVVTILDLPIAGTIVVFFFWWRRHRVAKEESWQDQHVQSSTESACILSHGLFSRGHYDLHHSQTRETTSLLLSSSYFMSVPAAVMTMEAEVAAVVLTLQVVSFVAIVSGMVLDRIVKWPNKQLADGKHQCLACPSPHGPGCVVTSHGVWHLVALVATATTFVAREYALSSYDSS